MIDNFAGFTPPADLPDLLIWESTDLDNLPDIVTGQRVNAMLVSLQGRLYTDAQGNDPLDADIFGYRPFIADGTPASATSALTAEQLARLNHFLTFIHGTPHASDGIGVICKTRTVALCCGSVDSCHFNLEC